jgi:TRAP-type C4-dicarboxylate transport system permease small subunit
VAAVFSVLLIPPVAHAAENPFVNARGQMANTQLHAGVADRSLEAVLGSFIKSAISIIGVIFFGLMVWAGYLWMTAHGETDKIEQAKKMISNAIIGLALTLAAYAITTFVVSRLTTAAGG